MQTAQDFRLAIVGLGYVGLPLAAESVEAGLQVTGFDVNQAVIEGLRAGKSHIDDLTDGQIAGMLSRGFAATAEEAALAATNVIVICVPTPLSDDGGPDLSAVVSATSAVGRNMQPGTLVILESTTYPGTTEEVVAPLLAETSGLIMGKEFEVAFSPERVDPGNKHFGTNNTPKVVGGLTPRATALASEFYKRFVRTVVLAKSAKEAEMAKLLENTYRHVNIALVNEMARFCHELNIDLWDVIRLAETKPFGFQAFYPGPGVGGHCIPIDPNYLSYNVHQRLGHRFRFVELAQEINASMPDYVARRAADLLNEKQKPVSGSSILILGVTYKADISDQRESPAIPLGEALLKRKATLMFHDPKVTSWQVGGERLEVIADLDKAVKEVDLVILVTAHSDYDADAMAEAAQLFLDTRGVTSSDKASRL